MTDRVFSQEIRPDSNGKAALVINEIMYHPQSGQGQPEDIRQEYIELYNRGTQTIDLSGWRLSDGVDCVFPDVTVGAGRYLVVAADVATFKAIHPGIADVVGGWDGRLSNSGESIDLLDSVGTTIDSVGYADQGDWGVRQLGPDDHAHRGWIWSDDHDGGDRSLELRNCEMPNEHGQNWGASLISGGTPGAINSIASDNIAPLILDVAHWPFIPGPDEPVTVSARIMDELTTGITAALHYRRDGEGSFEVVAMFDDGLGADGNANDGTYAAEIPAQADGTIIEFYVTASDAAAEWRSWPAASMVDGTLLQVTNALYQVHTSSPLKTGWDPGRQPVYHLIMSRQELTELQDIADRSYSGNLFASEAMSNAQMNATFISIDGVEATVRYGVGVRNRGNRKRADPPMSYHVNFRHDHLWKGVAAINLNNKYPHLELMGNVLFQMAGLPAADVTIVQLRVNGQNQAASDYSRSYGSYAAIEVLDSDWAGNHFPDDAAGNLYRCTYHDDGVHSRTYADLDHKESPDQIPDPDDYRDNYVKRTNTSQQDWSDLFSLIDALNNGDISDDDFVAEVSKVINLEKWMRYLAADALVGNREGGLTSGRGDDYAMYRGVEDTRFWLVPHDLDTVLGQGDHDYRPQLGIFVYAGVNGLTRLLSNPDVTKLYYRQYRDLAETVFAPENVYAMIDRFLGDWVGDSEIEGPRGMKQFTIDRINSILNGGYPAGVEPQIPQQFTINSSLPVVDSLHRTRSPVASLAGTANAIDTQSVTVNGQLVTEPDWSQRDGTWVIENIPLNPGINRIIIETFDGPNGTGRQVEQEHIDIWHDAGVTNDYPKNSGGEEWIAPKTSDAGLNLIVRDSFLPG
ncbi:MAG: CotH kinase family protein, partial [Planctomycetota bacterium]